MAQLSLLILSIFLTISFTTGHYIPLDNRSSLFQKSEQFLMDKRISQEIGRMRKNWSLSIHHSRSRRSNNNNQPSELGKESDLLLFIRSTGKKPELRKNSPNNFQCKYQPGQDEPQPLLCYQCHSNINEDRDPICDHTLWRFTRRSEKYKLRVKCPIGQGTYCVKKVQTSGGSEQQITERGCFGPGPVAGVTLQEGCVTYRQNDFLTTTCLCSSELCNASNQPQSQNYMFSLIVFWSWLSFRIFQRLLI